ncbi:MAG: HD domain-containing protein [Patescibacteria group bacterium]
MDKSILTNLNVFRRKLLRKKVFNFWLKFHRVFPGTEVFLVGGATRDIFLSREIKDYDFVVRNISLRRLEAWLKKNGRVSLVGKSFGVFKFTPRGFDGQIIEIALPRAEKSLGSGAYRDFKIQSNASLKIEEDLSRRDFTINAMAINLFARPDNIFIDPFNGLEDIKKRVIRTVGRPEERFREDYSRLLRAIRFACQLDFEIEKKTWASIKKLIPCLNKLNQRDEYLVPREIVGREFLKSLRAGFSRAIILWDKSGAFKILMPEILKMKKCPQPKEYHTEGDVWQHAMAIVEALRSLKFKKEFPKDNISGELMAAAFFHDIGKPYTLARQDGRLTFYNHDQESARLAQIICERLKLSSPEEVGIDIKKTIWLVKNHMLFSNNVEVMRPQTIAKYFFNADYPGIDLLKLHLADALASILPPRKPNLTNFYSCLRRIKDLGLLKKKNRKILPPPLNGHEIMKIFKIKPGPAIGRYLDILRKEQFLGRLKNRSSAEKFLRKLIAE